MPLQALQASLKKGRQDTLKMLDLVNLCNLVPVSGNPSRLLTTLTGTSMRLCWLQVLGQCRNTGIFVPSCQWHGGDAHCCGSCSTEELELLFGEHDDQAHGGRLAGRRYIWMRSFLCRQEILKLSHLLQSQFVAAFTGRVKIT